MKQKTLSILLKAVIIGVAICLAVIYIWIVPEIGGPLAEAGDGEFRYMYTPWLAIIEITALPILIALVLAWMIAENIGRDRSFSRENAKLLAAIAVLAAVDAGYFFIANVVMMLLNMNHPGLLICSLIACFVGACVCVAAGALSHLVLKAAKLQEQSDLTI